MRTDIHFKIFFHQKTEDNLSGNFQPDRKRSRLGPCRPPPRRGGELGGLLLKKCKSLQDYIYVQHWKD